MELLLATGNSHKQSEFASIMPGWRILVPGEVGLEFECDETGNSFAENALLKAEALYTVSRRAVIADDSGLCVDALGGEPGIHSARFGESYGTQLDARQKYELLLSRLEGVENRDAAFVCSLILYLGPMRYFLFQETCPGSITLNPRGTGGFGYDPVFLLPELDRTMAELDESEKNIHSHRGRAGAALRAFLSVHGGKLGLV
jgi:XTP/dITP diphosphohydrolase